MPRPGISTDMAAMLTARTVFPVLLAEIHFNSAISYVWSGRGSITWNGHTWIGMGMFAGMGQIQESVELEISGTSLQLSGVPGHDAAGNPIDMVQQALTECKQGNSVLLYFGFFDNGAQSLVVDPTLAFSGRMDAIPIEVGDVLAVQMNLEQRRVDIHRKRERRYTDSDQKLDYATDKGFNHVGELQDWAGAGGKGAIVPRKPPYIPPTHKNPAGD